MLVLFVEDTRLGLMLRLSLVARYSNGNAGGHGPV
jgi:hypothetical protein